MSETAAFGVPAWLPASVQRRQAAEDARERAEARRADRERAEADERRHEAAVQAWAAAAEVRGEAVSAMQLATGEGIGRSLGDVFAEARAAADREDGRAEALRRRLDESGELIYAEPRIHASRSGWPESERELDRMLRRADELHRDLVAVRARRDYPAAVEAARAKSDPFVERAAPPGREVIRNGGYVTDVW